MDAELKRRRTMRIAKAILASEVEKAWLAGVIDGEGHIALRNNSAELTVTNLQRELIAKFDYVLELGAIRTYKAPNGKTVYRWVVTGPDAAAVLFVLFPHFGSDKTRERARIAMEPYRVGDSFRLPSV